MDDVSKKILNQQDCRYKEISNNIRGFNYPFIGSRVSKESLLELKAIANENIVLSENYIKYIDQELKRF